MKELIRSFLAKRGYVLWKWNFVRFGISPFLDMSRLNSVWGRRMEVVFDVGANVGQFAKEVRREVPGAIIHSFEPHPKTFEVLVRSKADDRMFHYCLALGDRTGPVSFFDYGKHCDINSLVPDSRVTTQFGMSSTEITVDGSTLDDFCADHRINRIDFLKIDVEGAELLMLKGAQGMLSAGQIMAVYCEFNDLDAAADAAGGGLIPIAHYLRDFGLRYACTYTDYLLLRGELFVCANALFVLPPGRQEASKRN